MKQKEMLLLLGSLLILVIAWISFSIYHNSVTPTASLSLESIVKPINRNFDESTIEKLQERKTISPVYEFDNIVISEDIPSITPTITLDPNQSTDSSPNNEDQISTNEEQLEP